jgi:uncharacterized membrane protein HdeD (DUF308 family)
MTEMHAHGVSLEARETVKEAASLWWLFLLTGIAWIIVAWLILRWDYSTVTSISYLFGFLAIAAGVNELFLLAGSSFGWKLFHGILGLLFVAAGVFALFNPFETFSALASLVGLYFIVKGTFDVVVSIATRDEIPVWWIQLLVGLVELGLGFWASGPGFETYGNQVVLLVVWAGLMCLFRGITEIIFAFKLRGVGHALQQA